MPGHDKVRAGEKIRPRAAFWNQVVDLVENDKRQQLGRRRPPAKPKPVYPDWVKIKNTIEADLAAGSVVELGSFILDDVVRAYLWFEGVTPTLAHGKHHGVILRAVEENEYVFTQLGGVVAARVLVTNVAHAYCLPTASQTYFTSSPIGPYRLLSTPSSIDGSEEHLLPVALNGGVLTLLADCDEEAGIASGASGTFDIVDGTPGSETSTGISCDAFNDGPAIADGDRCSLSLINWRVYASLVACS